MNSRQVLERLIAELELALESDRGATTSFKAYVWRALERARGTKHDTPYPPLRGNRLVN